MIKYIVMMPNSWGSGDSLAAAEKAARKEGGHKKKDVKRLAWRFDTSKTPTAYIDDMGSMCWEGDKPERVNL
jgi:hypothetical protein